MRHDRGPFQDDIFADKRIKCFRMFRDKALFDLTLMD